MKRREFIGRRGGVMAARRARSSITYNTTH
jgi:hypothetical protein